LHYSSNDIHNLFDLVRSIPGVAEDSTGRKFTGVGVDESAADDLRRRQEEREAAPVAPNRALAAQVMGFMQAKQRGGHGSGG